MSDLDCQALGQRLRRQRLWQQLSLEELAARSGLSKGYLSRIENGHIAPAVATLATLARATGVSVADLLGEQAEERPVYLPAATATAQLRPSERGYQFVAMGASRRQALLQPFLFEAKRGALPTDLGLQHAGEEFVHVIAGQLRFRVGAQTYDLAAGDSLVFDSATPHDMEALSASARWLAVFVAPATQRRAYRRSTPAPTPPTSRKAPHAARALRSRPS